MKHVHHFQLSTLSLAMLSVLTTNHTFAASNLTITPLLGSIIPTKVYQGGTVPAYYTVKNNTHKTLSGLSIQGLAHWPVTQNTASIYCAAPITLPPGKSCTLALNITGAVQSGFALCYKSMCSTAAVPLNVRMVGLPPMIAAGFNYNGTNTIPLLAQSSDGGLTWSYPTSINNQYPGGVNFAALFSASCSGHYCVAAGEDNNGTNTAAILTQSSDGGLTWSYPSSITSQSPDIGDDTAFYSASCSGNYCVAVGKNKNEKHTIPLLAQSSDGGATWSYPTSIASQFPGVVNVAFFLSVSCSGNYCVAVGEDYNGTHRIPLLAQSSDGGLTWVYPTSITGQFPGVVNDAYFKSASCSGNYCVAVGEDLNGIHNTVPLLAQSSDGGLTWVYPTSITNQFPGVINSAFFNSVSCSGHYCVAAGVNNNGAHTAPLLAQSSDGGLTWVYPTAITSQLPGFGDNAYFKSVSCSGNYCIAVGENYNGVNTIPLLAQSSDGGATWSYPTSITSQFPDIAQTASFIGASCSGSYCVAAGQNHTGTQTFPVLAQSSDGGLTWSYPTSITNQFPGTVNNAGFYSVSVSMASLLPDSLRVYK